MTFRNRHSLVSGFLCTIIFISGACALGGCVEITEPQGIGSTDEDGRMPLTIRATVSDYIAIGEDGAPTTRIPTENGFTTEFEDGDAIGIFALVEYETPDVATVDDVYNLKLVYTKAADGTGSWAPEDDTKALYSYNDDLTYIAYYPYRDGVTIKQDNYIEIFKRLARDLPPAADQSTPEAYTGSDLMAAFAKPTTDPTDANKKVLTLNFEHLHGLLVFKPTEGFLRYVSPDGGFEYRDETNITINSPATEATINNVKACLMNDGSFRAIFPVSASGNAFTPSGSYLLADGKSLLFTGSELAAGTFRPGKCYTLETGSQLGTIPRSLQIGDFFYNDGKILNREASFIPDTKNCIGVVFYVGRHPEDNGVYVDKNNNPMEVHGYVINKSEATDQHHNGGGTDFGTYKSTTDFNGYFNTDKLQAVPAGYNDMMTYVRAQTNSPQTTSGWFLPSIGQLNYIKKNYAEIISKSFDKCGGAMGRGWQHYYWSSTEVNAANSYCINWDSGSYYAKGKNSGAMVRTALVF